MIVSRANIQIASLPTASLGIVLASKSWADMINLPAILYIVLFFTILTYSCNINCLNDIEVDEISKKNLSKAVKEIGAPNLKKVMSIEILIASLIILLLCILKRDFIYSLGVVGLVCGYVYSAPPLRIKKRGLFSPLPVMFGLYFLPIIAGWFIITNQLSVYIIIFALGYALIMEGITFINTCEDFEEDANLEIQTLAHVLGIRKTLILGSIFISTGGFIDIILIYNRINLRNLRLIILMFILMMSIFFIMTIVSIAKRLYTISKSSDPIIQSKIHAPKMPMWFISTRYPLLGIAILIVYT